MSIIGMMAAVAYMAVARPQAQPAMAPPAPAAYPSEVSAGAVADSIMLPLGTTQTVPQTYEDLMREEFAYDLDTPSNITTTAEYDPVTRCYVVRTKVGDMDIATPFMLNEAQYNNWQFRKSMERYY
ncbi:MAG: hypothetical protein K2L80_09355, partial [Muribaculaceae bacterium]|nr:hypothetical protein [Muribaculaceae bacterium]